LTVCFIDTETRARTPIQRGTDLYARDAQCMIVTWAVGDDTTQIWDVMNEVGMPAALNYLLRNDDVVLVAHSASFDRAIIRHALGIHTDIARWRCTKAQAYSHGLPGSLDLLGLVLGLPPDQQKLAEAGHRLIQLFCIPRADGSFTHPTEKPNEWNEFKGYATRDTDTLREIYRKLPSHNYTGDNLRLWGIDQSINERGFGFDSRLAGAAVGFLKEAKGRSDRAVSEATQGAVTAVTQRDKLLAHLQKSLGLDIPNLRAAELREMLESDDLSPEARFLIEARIEGSKSASAKYHTGLRNVGPGGRMRQTLQFNGAGRTGRWTGRGYQPHNMARPVIAVPQASGRIKLVSVKADYIDDVVIPGITSGAALDNSLMYGGPNEACALALRHAIVAAPGNELVVADYSNIESRILAWIANEEWKLEVFRAMDRGEGLDPYKILYASFFGTAIADVNETERQSGKVSELAFGFGGGVGALVTMAATYQMDLTPLADLVLPRATEDSLKKAHKAWRRAFLTGEDYLLEPRVYQACDVLKQTYRKANAKINAVRHDVDNAVKTAVREPGRAFAVARCMIWSTSTWLIIALPSGRRLLYANPRIESETLKDPDTGEPVFREWLSYATARGKTWRREKSWSGLFIENIVQAVANDVLRIGLLRVHDDTLTVPAIVAYLATLDPEERTAISLHVHDEIVLDAPIGSYSLERLIARATKLAKWAAGLPLAAAGWTGGRYGKRG
jgi:DNA polymerase